MVQNLYTLKYILVGNSYVGKSSILTNYLHGNFNDLHSTTIGVDFGVKRIKLNNNNYKLRIWDTAGQEKFKSIVQTYYRDVIGAILVYDICDRSSFDNIMNWIKNIKCNTNNTMAFILVANKTDKATERVISTQDGEFFAEMNNMLYIETSAKMNTNINEIFDTLTVHVQDTIINNDIDKTNRGYNILDMNNDNPQQYIDLNKSNNWKYNLCC
jgi:small GTP-binding protein